MTNTDLSEIHNPVGDLFSPSEDLDRFKLSDEQLAFYDENGYVAGIKLLTEEQCETLCEELAIFGQEKHPGWELWYEYHSNESSDPGTVLFHSLGAWRITPGFHDVLWNPAFVVPAFQLLGGPVRFWHDQLFCKPKHHGGVVAWHQDYSYWTRSQPMSHLTCWIGLDDSTEENGCLQYIPRSHRWPLLPRTDLAGNMTAILEILTEEQRAQFKPKPMEMKRGYAAFHHPLLVHGSYENRSPRQRRATVINTSLDGFWADTDEPLLEGVPAFKKGQKIEGPFFPLLFDGAGINV